VREISTKSSGRPVFHPLPRETGAENVRSISGYPWSGTGLGSVSIQSSATSAWYSQKPTFSVRSYISFMGARAKSSSSDYPIDRQGTTPLACLENYKHTAQPGFLRKALNVLKSCKSLAMVTPLPAFSTAMSCRRSGTSIRCSRGRCGRQPLLRRRATGRLPTEQTGCKTIGEPSHLRRSSPSNG
jgi:hypothetical protein